MKDLILIKLGGSIITDKTKPFTAKKGAIKRLAVEIKSARAKLKKSDFIIGHGSGSFGHTVASKYKTQDGLIGKDSLKGLCLTSDAAVEINRIVIEELLHCGLKVITFSPVSLIFSNSDKPKNIFTQPLGHALKLNLTPVLYGDVIFDSKKGFTIYSCEKTLDILARRLSKNYKKIVVIQCGDTNGVYDRNGRVIPKITKKNFNTIKKYLGGANTIDVTGGMLHKVEEALNLARETGISTVITNGNKKGYLLNAILGKKVDGTVIG